MKKIYFSFWRDTKKIVQTSYIKNVKLFIIWTIVKTGKDILNVNLVFKWIEFTVCLKWCFVFCISWIMTLMSLLNFCYPCCKCFESILIWHVIISRVQILHEWHTVEKRSNYYYYLLIDEHVKRPEMFAKEKLKKKIDIFEKWLNHILKWKY